jgi:glycosyltransferase involved in cell wall biosynthesis
MSQDHPSPTVVSVIVPTFNRAPTLERAVASVLAQTYPHLEVIVVDDASTDGSDQVARSIVDQRVRYIRHHENRGAAAARNTGLQAATGHYVSFLDSDDVWLPERVERFVRAVDLDGDAAANTVYYGQTINDDGLKRMVLPRRAKREDESVASYTFRANCDMTMIAIMLRRDLASRVLFREELRRHEDVDFLMRLERVGVRFRFVPGALALYHREQRADRISVAPEPAPSIAWIEGWSSELSPQEVRAFNARIVAPLLAVGGQRAKAVRLVLNAAWHRSIYLVDALKHFANFLLPAQVSDRLKVAWGRVSRSRHTAA